ncbi:MAG: hypothetical protein PVI59_12040 [Anaerolineae bacterium]|jgi:hypothetical protein
MAKSCKECVVKIFGACRGDYCGAERRGLEERAQREVARRGHAVKTFEKVNRYPVWKARCERCGREVVYTLDREPGEPPFSGEALDADCPGIAP